MVNKYLVNYPNEPYYVKSEIEGGINQANSEIDPKSLKVLTTLEKKSKEDQPEAMGLYPILQDCGLDTQEFFHAMVELMDKEYIKVDYYGAAPARTLIVAKA